MPAAISHDAVLAARAAFVRRRDAMAANNNRTRSDDSDDSVIAYHVTHAQVAALPGEWIHGLRLALRADGALVIAKLIGGADYTRAVSDVAGQVYDYAAMLPNAAVTSGRLLRSSDGDRRMRGTEPDLQLVVSEPDRPVPLTIAVFDVEMAGTSCHGLIAKADAYLSEMASVQRVVVFQLFPVCKHRPRGVARYHSVRAPQYRYEYLTALSVPALAIVFERIENTAPGDRSRRLRVAQMRSFGNAPVDTTALAAFSEPPDDSPLESFLDAYAHAAPVSETVLPRRFWLGTLRAELDRVRCTKTVAFDVTMDAPYPALHVDLVTVFVAAMDGWLERFRAQCAATAATTLNDGTVATEKQV